MSRDSNDENAFVAVAIIVLGLLALGVWKFSSAIGVNFETGLSVLLRTGGVLAVCIALLKLDILSLGQVIPALIGGLAWAFFPALDYWSAQATGEMQFGFSLGEPMWYARWYSKAAFVFVPSLGGYGLRYAFPR
ncbi:MAG: hypothetical protein WAW87_05625 [Candidatus Ferrigenium altingense]